MSQEASQLEQFASGESKVELFGGICAVLMCFPTWLASENPEAVCVVFAFGVWQVWRGLRHKNLPYIQIGDGHLLVFDRGRIKHRITLGSIRDVRQGFNRTVLLLSDGMTLPISHLNFVGGDDAERFRNLIRRILDGPASHSNQSA